MVRIFGRGDSGLDCCQLNPGDVCVIDMARKRFHRAAIKFLVAVWIFGDGRTGEDDQETVAEKSIPDGCYQVEVDRKTVAKRFSDF